MQGAEIPHLLSLLGSSGSWSGGKFHASCPLAKWTHGNGRDSSPSFAFYKTSHGNWKWKCLACQHGGHPYELYWKMRSYTKDIPMEVNRIVYDTFGDPEDIEPPIESLQFGLGGIWGAPQVKQKDAPVKKGAQTSLTTQVVQKKIPDHEVVKVESWMAQELPGSVVGRVGADSVAAWGLGFDSYKKRWIFPCWNADHEMVGYTGRLVWDQPHCFRCGRHVVNDEKTREKRKANPKAPYVYDPRCEFCGTWYVKYKHSSGKWRQYNLYGIHMHVEGEPVVITEGTTDAINLWRHGVRHPVAVFGATLTPEQAEVIAKRTKKAVLMGDPDEAGQKLNKDAKELLESMGVEVEIAKTSEKDPGDMSRDEIHELVSTLTTTILVDR